MCRRRPRRRPRAAKSVSRVAQCRPWVSVVVVAVCLPEAGLVGRLEPELHAVLLLIQTRRRHRRATAFRALLLLQPGQRLGEGGAGFATPLNSVSTPHVATRGRDAQVLHAARLTAIAMPALRMTPATMSGCDIMRKWEAPSTSVTVEPARW